MLKSRDLDTYYGIKVRKGALGDQDRGVVNELVLGDAYRLDARHLMPRRPSFVIDVGAHIGVFPRLWHFRNPAAKIVCVEVCPENWPILEVNTALIAEIERGACTYEDGPVILHNSIMDGGTATGGSILVEDGAPHSDNIHAGMYWLDKRPIQKFTLEDIMRKHAFPRIDCLKLDCEGSEFSILEHTPSLEKIGFICGEYHGRDRWEDLRRRRFHEWDYSQHGGGDFGLFHLQNPRWAQDFVDPEE